MPTKRITKVESEPILSKTTPPTRPSLHKVNDALSLVFYIVWIVIGLFFLLVIAGEVRQGALTSLIGGAPSPAPETSIPSETELPGVGIVNIACVESSLSSEAIQKLVIQGDASTLTDEEKAKLDPCIVSAESSPSESPAN